MPDRPGEPGASERMTHVEADAELRDYVVDPHADRRVVRESNMEATMSQQTTSHSVTGDPYQVHDYDCRPLGPCPEIRLTNGAVIGVCMLPVDLAEVARAAARAEPSSTVR